MQGVGGPTAAALTRWETPFARKGVNICVRRVNTQAHLILLIFLLLLVLLVFPLLLVLDQKFGVVEAEVKAVVQEACRAQGKGDSWSRFAGRSQTLQAATGLSLCCEML